MGFARAFEVDGEFAAFHVFGDRDRQWLDARNGLHGFHVHHEAGIVFPGGDSALGGVGAELGGAIRLDIGARVRNRGISGRHGDRAGIQRLAINGNFRRDIDGW